MNRFLNYLGFFIVFVVLLFVGAVKYVLYEHQAPYRKEAILAGHASGSIIDYRLLVYPDSTWYTSPANESNSGNRNWTLSGDTVILNLNEKGCAKIFDNKLIGIPAKGLRHLTLMRYVSFPKPKVVSFPKNE